jgi:predicted ATP-grasp superfamily ATP-dependent carboligase
LAARPAVLLGGDATAVPVARSLGRAGIRVHALGGSSDPVRRSRYVAEYVDLGAGDGFQERALEWLIARAPADGVVLPCSDEGLELVAWNRAALEERGLAPIEADDQKLLDVLDKERTHELAVEHGIPVPPTATVSSAEELRQAVDEIGFPCALKPLHAHEFRRHFEGKGFVADSWSDLEEFFRLSEEAGVEMLVTEMVHGPDRYHSSYTYLDEHGEPLFTFTKQKLRQYPITFGAGVYHVMDWNEEVSDLGMRFCRSVGLRGLLNVEFKRDSRDGRLVLIECNHRFTASSALHLAAGLDVPLFVYNRLTGRPLPHVGRPYKEGATLWYPLDDFRAFKEYRRRGEMTTLQYVRSVARPQRFSVASVSDPGPLVLAVKPRVRGLWRRIRRRLGLGRREERAGTVATASVKAEANVERTPAGTRS